MALPRFACFAGRAVRSLEHALNKQAGNFPGVVAKRIDSNVLAYEAQKILDTAVVTTGTNGKTTTNNLLASCMEAAGNEVFCNREGSNLETGVITALLDKRKAPFALLECDEMYTRFVLPKVHPRLFCLLNLFPGDQIYRFGSMERIFDAVADACNGSTETVLVMNGDDPNCRAVTVRAPQNACITFGIEGACADDGADTFEGATCPSCGAALGYSLRHYGQLGRWACPACGETAPALDVTARNIREQDGHYIIDIAGSTKLLGGCTFDVADVTVPCTGLYMVYNVLAVRIATALMGCDADTFKRVVATFDPKNGRLQSFEVAGRPIMTNMAKNPVGFNQNIHMALKHTNPSAIAFLMDDMVECNGDYSWVDGIEFSALAETALAGTPIFYGGEIAEPLKRALDAAKIPARRADKVADVLAALDSHDGRKLFVIANYHALERVCHELEGLAS